MALVRTNITIPAETLALVDEVAGRRGRSAYIAEVLAKQAKRDRMRKVWEENRGVLKGSTTWGTTPEEVLATIREIRAGWDRAEVDPRRTEEASGAESPGHDDFVRMGIPVLTYGVEAPGA